MNSGRDCEGVRTSGVVIDITVSHSTSTDSDGRKTTTTYYHPEVKFRDQSGDYVKFTGSGGGAGEYEKGQEVEIVYPLENPSEAKIDSFVELYAGSIALCCLGIIFTVLPLYVFRIMSKAAKPARQIKVENHDPEDIKKMRQKILGKK